jgi:hypothetical protein
MKDVITVLISALLATTSLGADPVEQKVLEAIKYLIQRRLGTVGPIARRIEKRRLAQDR